MATQTHYEVHVLQNGRWGIHAQFASGEKDLAVEEGKLQDGQAGNDAVKVVREVYDPAESTHRDFVIYKSLDLSSALKKAGTTGSSKTHGNKSNHTNDDDDWYDEDEFDDDDESFGDDQWSDGASKKRKNKNKKKKNPNQKETTVTRVLVKLLVVTLISISLAGVLTVITSNVLHGTILFGNRMQGNFEGNVLFVVFVLTFILSAASLTVSQLKGTTLAKDTKKQPLKTAPQSKSKKPTPIEKFNKNKTKEEALRTHNELDAAMEGIQEFKIEDQQKSEAEDATDERLKSAINEDENSSNDKQDGTLKTDGRETVETLSPHAEKQKKYMMDFLTTTLKNSGTDQQKLDNFNKFGVNLFLAGACEILSHTQNLDEKSRDKVLSDSVRVMGFKKSHATSFASKYEDYLMQDPRYMQIFQAGRNAMNTYFQDEKSASRHMKTALEEWNKPKQKAEKAGPVTVLFTDIAGSTAMTQALGDEGAQKVVRAHNRVVREALTDWNGKEIKHTGDGIMASFARITDSVEASIQMQRETHIYNEQTPDLPLHLKIGLNAGEPIAEDNDLFGTVVQMAARIVDKAQADEIYVSDIIRGICIGKSYNLINRGGFAMKGFDEDPTLYEVVWREDGATAAQ